MRVCAFGDSFVNGTGDPEWLGWLGRASAGARDATVYNLGIRGDTSADIAARWQAEAARRFPMGEDNRLIFSFGTNDVCPAVDGSTPRVPLDASISNVEAILRAGRVLGPTLLVGPPPIADHAVNARTAALDSAFAETARRLDVPYCPVFAALAGEAAWMEEVAAGDGAHPGARGYAALAAIIRGWMPWQAWFAAPER